MAIDVGKFRANVAAQRQPNKEAFSLAELLKKDISLSGKTLNDKQKERLYSTLHTLMSSGIAMKTALELLESEEENVKQKKLFGAIGEAVIGGVSLSKALEQTGQFGPYEYFSVKIGEESGRLNTVLNELALFYGKKQQLKKKLVNALTYPLFVMSFALGVVAFMMVFVVPMFSGIFKRFDSELPGITKWVIAVSDLFIDNYQLGFVGILAVGIFIFTQSKKTWFRKRTAVIGGKVPFFGELVQKIYLARFCQSMHLLLSSNTPLVEALDLVGKMIRFYPIEKSLQSLTDDIMRGEAFYEGLQKHSIYSKRMVSLIKVGEEVNQLEAMFGRLSKQYNEEVEHQTSLMSSVIEPVLIVFVAIVVGVVLLAMYLPLFELGMTIK